jgi:hypothetical protein
VTDEDLQQFAELSQEFFAALIDAYPAWLTAAAVAVAGSNQVTGLAEAVAESCQIARAKFDLYLTTDLAEITTNPLSILRASIAPVTAELARAGVLPVQRDPFLVDQFPADIYGLNPASFGDLAENLTEMGIAWGAARAYLHIQSHP